MRKQFVNSTLDLAFVPTFERRNQTHVSLDGEVWEEAAFLNHVTGAASQTNRIPLGRRLILQPSPDQRSATGGG